MIRIRSIPLAAVVLVVVFGGIFAAKVVGAWKTTSTKKPARISSGEFAGMPNPSDIRGSYTWLDIEKAFGINAAEAAALFSTSDFTVDPAARVNALEGFYAGRLPEGKEIGTDSVRLFVSRLVGLPHEGEEGSALPAAAVDYLAARGKADAVVLASRVELAALAATVPEVTTTPAVAAPVAAVPAAAVPAATPAPEGTGQGTPTAEHNPEDRKVGGATTFGDLYEWGLTEAEAEKALGFKPGPASVGIRDAVQKNGRAFSTIKTELQKLVDSKK